MVGSPWKETGREFGATGTKQESIEYPAGIFAAGATCAIVVSSQDMLVGSGFGETGAGVAESRVRERAVADDKQEVHQAGNGWNAGFNGLHSEYSDWLCIYWIKAWPHPRLGP
jgi:hypothetical protein